MPNAQHSEKGWKFLKGSDLPSSSKTHKANHRNFISRIVLFESDLKLTLWSNVCISCCLEVRWEYVWNKINPYAHFKMFMKLACFDLFWLPPASIYIKSRFSTFDDIHYHMIAPSYQYHRVYKAFFKVGRFSTLFEKILCFWMLVIRLDSIKKTPTGRVQR